MIAVHNAIVLCVPMPQRKGYLFFDQRLGTITVHRYKNHTQHPLCRGALIQYQPQFVGAWYSAEQVEIVAIPQPWAAGHIWFLHHILELIDFFVPRSHRAENIFGLMQLLYQPLSAEIDIPFFQKLLLCKFFSMIGIYPEPRNALDQEFLLLLGSGIEPEVYSRFDEQKYVFLEKKMIQWIRECTLLHPHADRLKTMIMEPW